MLAVPPPPPVTGPLAALAPVQHYTYAFRTGAAMLAVQAWIADEAARSARFSGMAMSLVAGAARFLPAAERDRYREEFESELFDLTGGRRAQIRYALRILGRAWSLRRALGDEEPEW
jgi:hypothetical protein